MTNFEVSRKRKFVNSNTQAEAEDTVEKLIVVSAELNAATKSQGDYTIDGRNRSFHEGGFFKLSTNCASTSPWHRKCTSPGTVSWCASLPRGPFHFDTFGMLVIAQIGP
jgi:hypothetical protein